MGATGCCGFTTAAKNVNVIKVGEWLSLVEHSVRDAGVGGSNPLFPTTYEYKRLDAC